MPEVNWLAVLAATVAAFVLGGLWYSPVLFGKRWQAAAASSPRGFGAEDVRTPERYAPPAGQLQQISARITAVRPREPGIYTFTLEDGAEWLFAEGVASSYRVPRAGSEVEIERGALGSFLMRFDDQTPVPVRRVR